MFRYRAKPEHTTYTDSKYRLQHHVIETVKDFDNCHVKFNVGLLDLEAYAYPPENGRNLPIDAPLLMLHMVGMTKAMTLYLERAYSTLPPLGESYTAMEEAAFRSRTIRRVRSPPSENLWLRRAMAELEVACHEFSWIALQICLAKVDPDSLVEDQYDSTPAAQLKTYATHGPRLRSYNSLSTLGSC